jgi:hypothetical protein
MKKHRGFSNAKKNPQGKHVKTIVTMRLDASTIAYFRKLAGETSLPYLALINLYLGDCAASGRRLELSWRTSKTGAA